jgi:TATA-binding protein-associated factor
LLKISMPSVTYLRLDGSIPPSDRHGIVTKFNNDVSIDLLLLTTSVGKFINNFLFRHHS